MTDRHRDESYEIDFTTGHRFCLIDTPGTFRVSQAGVALGNHLAEHLSTEELGGRILEVGTGSGAIALLLRGLGATSVVATDISGAAVSTARQNELHNYSNSDIDFVECDLFPADASAGGARFDLVVFNPPGWRTPPSSLMQNPDDPLHDLDLRTMFYGDAVLLRFLQLLPQHLAEGGRALVGINSLIGIDDVLERSQVDRGSPEVVASELRERHEFPLMFYTDEWRDASTSLLTEFMKGKEEYAATYVTRGGIMYWYYDITEFTVRGSAVDSDPPVDVDLNREPAGPGSPQLLAAVE
jgi:release factor glutamine methyltransferase